MFKTYTNNASHVMIMINIYKRWHPLISNSRDIVFQWPCNFADKC